MLVDSHGKSEGNLARPPAGVVLVYRCYLPNRAGVTIPDFIVSKSWQVMGPRAKKYSRLGAKEQR